jgi:hypothetical protein
MRARFLFSLYLAAVGLGHHATYLLTFIQYACYYVQIQPGGKSFVGEFRLSSCK